MNIEKQRGIKYNICEEIEELNYHSITKNYVLLLEHTSITETDIGSHSAVEELLCLNSQ